MCGCSPPNELVKRRELFQDLVGWLFKSLVFPILRSLFYITEREGVSSDIVYYQRDVWDAIRCVHVSACGNLSYDSAH